MIGLDPLDRVGSADLPKAGTNLITDPLPGHLQFNIFWE